MNLKRLLAALTLAVLTVLCAATASAESESPSPAFRVVLMPTMEDDGLTLDVRVDGIPASLPLIGVLFELRYDPDALRLVSERNRDGSLVCVERVPGDRWENLTVSDTDGVIRAAVAVTEDLSQTAKGDGSILLRFRFRVQEEAPASTVLTVPTASAGGMTTAFQPASGEGASAELILHAGEDSSSPSSEPPKDEPAPSADVGSLLPPTGDPVNAYPALLFCGSLLGIFSAVGIRKKKQH